MTPESRNSGSRVDFVLTDLELRESLEKAVEYDWEEMQMNRLKGGVWFEDSGEIVINLLLGYT
jgi:hypothetical protein